MFRKTFTVSKTVASATAYVCGLGLHEFHINGQKVGTNVQEPLWTTYTKKCFYVTYNVTSLLTQGTNAMGVMLGNGFYNVDATDTGNRYCKYEGTFGPKKMIMQLVINYSDGTSATIVSDASRHVATSPITFSSIYGGEDYDARLEQTGWDTPSFTEMRAGRRQRFVPDRAARSWPSMGSRFRSERSGPPERPRRLPEAPMSIIWGRILPEFR